MTQTWLYDAFNRVIQKVDIYGNVTTFKHDDDALTNQSSMNGDVRTKLSADGCGRPVQIITYADSAAASTYDLVLERVYNGFGKVMTTKHSQQPVDGSTATLLSQKDVVYDVEQKPSAITLSSLPSALTGDMDKVVRTFTFDIFGNSVTYSKEVTYSNGSKYTHNGPVSSFDACNRLVQLTNQLNQVETNDYDADGRLTTLTRYDGTKFTYVHDKVGQLLSTTTPEGTTEYQYASNGRLTSVSSGTATITHTYSPDGCINSTVFPDGRKQTYVLDQYSRVTQETDAAGHSTANTFDSYGRIGSKQMDNNKIVYNYGTVNHTNGIHIGCSFTGSQQYSSQISYDGFGRQNQVANQNQKGSVTLKCVYVRDSRGHLLSCQLSSQTDQDAAVNNQRSLTYDGFGQLTSDSVTYHQGGPAAQSYQFKYDGNSNVIEKTTNGSPSMFTYNTLDQRQDSGFVYDKNGRLSSDPAGRQYSYSSEDRLTSVTYQNTTTTYKYNPDSSLANSATAKANTTFYYDCGAVNSTLSTTGNSQSSTSYLLDPSRRVAAEQDGQDTALFLDSRDSVVMSLGTSASTTYDYQAYGAPTATTNPSTFGWNRELMDPNNGLVYLRSRYYQPDQMAFITMDSSRGEENRYAYCYGDPINLADGSGHDARSIGAAIAGVLVGIAITFATGQVLEGIAAAASIEICATEVTAVGIGASVVSNAAGTVAGDATNAAIQGQRFTATRAMDDLAMGAVGGAVGAGSGGLAGKAAIQMAESKGLSEFLSQKIGNATCNIIGGGLNSFSSTETGNLLNNRPLLSWNTALSTVEGLVGGIAHTGVQEGVAWARVSLAVTLMDAEQAITSDTAIPSNSRTTSDGDAGTPQTSTSKDRNTDETKGTDVRSTSGRVVAHGEAGRMWSSVRYQREAFHRPIRATSSAHVSGSRPDLQIKPISCNGGWSSAQNIAEALQKPIWSPYGAIPGAERPDWHLFKPRSFTM